MLTHSTYQNLDTGAPAERRFLVIVEARGASVFIHGSSPLEAQAKARAWEDKARADALTQISTGAVLRGANAARQRARCKPRKPSKETA